MYFTHTIIFPGDFFLKHQFIVSTAINGTDSGTDDKDQLFQAIPSKNKVL